MKVEIVEDGLIIVPETEFEKDYLTLNFPLTLTFNSFMKCGITPKDLIGLKISKDEQ